MRGDAAVLDQNCYVETSSICRKNFRMSDALLTGLIYLCAGVSMMIIPGQIHAALRHPFCRLGDSHRTGGRIVAASRPEP